MPALLFNEAWDAKHYEKEIVEEAKNGLVKLEEKIIVLENYEQGVEEKIAVATKGFHHSLLPKIVQTMTHVRGESEFLISLSHAEARPLLLEACKRLGVNIYEIRKLTPQEIGEMLGGKISKKVFEERATLNGFYSDCEKETFLDEKTLRELEKTVPKRVEQTMALCACAGVAVGKARVVSGKSSVAAFRQGEILVAKSTMADYLPAMRKAAAIITENGGITSHASIISREFNVPCIVGLKNAVEKFGGKIVRVDATNGKVSVLHHAAG